MVHYLVNKENSKNEIHLYKIIHRILVKILHMIII